jgi:hypothetical protein
MAARKTKATGRPVGAKSKPRTPLISGDTAPPGNRKGGNPPIPFRSDFHCAFALRQCLLGATDAELADDLGVSPSTLYLWQQRYPEFRQAMLDGKRFADGHVAAKAYQGAVGFRETTTSVVVVSDGKGAGSHAEVVEHAVYYPPSPQLIRLWLQSRQRTY